MSDTPETDAESGIEMFDENGQSYISQVVDADFARRLERERDEAREVVSRIEEIFCDGEDTHDDWMKMGNIARDYLKGLE